MSAPAKFQRKAGFVLYLGVVHNPALSTLLKDLGCEIVPCGDPRWAIIEHPEAGDDGHEPTRNFDPCDLNP